MLKNFLAIYEGKNERIPVWFMRQAGRYLPEYMEVRKNFSDFVEFCLTPEAAAEVTLQPLKRFDLDAAIIFADILLIPEALGKKVTFKPDHGPMIEKISSINEVHDLEIVNPKVFEKVQKSLSLVRKELDANYPGKTLIGFAGSPFTIASYMIEGEGGRGEFKNMRYFMAQNPSIVKLLINKIVAATKEYIDYQIEGGAEVIKLFESSGSIVPAYLFDEFVFEPNLELVRYIKSKSAKSLVFPRGAGYNINKFLDHPEFEAIAVDSSLNISDISTDKVIQGNLDNFLLANGRVEDILKQVNNIIKSTEGKKLIFNLGHGILPQTPIEHVSEVVNCIRNHKS